MVKKERMIGAPKAVRESVEEEMMKPEPTYETRQARIKRLHRELYGYGTDVNAHGYGSDAHDPAWYKCNRARMYALVAERMKNPINVEVKKRTKAAIQKLEKERQRLTEERRKLKKAPFLLSRLAQAIDNMPPDPIDDDYGMSREELFGVPKKAT